MTFLTRKKLGYAPGISDGIFLSQDIDELEVKLHIGTDMDTVLMASIEFETEARRIGSVDLLIPILIQRADILLAKKNAHQAISVLNNANKALGDLRKFDLKVHICVRLADAYAHLQDWEKVLTICGEGIEIVETYRYNINGQYLKSSYLRSRIKLYNHGVYAAYKKNLLPLMLKYAELSKARFVVRNQSQTNALTISEEEKQIEQKFLKVCEQIEAARANNEGKVSSDLLMERRSLWDLLLIHQAQNKSENNFSEFDPIQFRALLKSDEAVLYYYWLSNHALLIIYIDNQQYIPIVSSVSSTQYEKLKEFTGKILKLNRDMPNYLLFVDGIMDFADLIFPSSVKNHIKNKRHLIISPNKILHALPFQALPWDNEHRYLIQRFAITYIPNLTSKLLSYSVSAKPHLLALGVSEYQVPGEQYNTLKMAEIEVSDLHQFCSQQNINIQSLLGADASENQLRQLAQSGKLSTFTILHFSTHGESVNSDNPMESYLVLHNSLLDGLEIANWSLNAELVVLNACCSGQRATMGRQIKGQVSEFPGDDLFGLQAAFFTAGAKQILGCLWPVEDESAHEIIIDFYRFLLTGLTPEYALQKSIINYINKVGIRLRKPYYWAAFFISAIGNSSPIN